MPRNNSHNDTKTENAIAKYQVAIDKNISESEVLWSRYNAILVFNTILITLIGLSYQDSVNLPLLIKVFLPFFGLVTCWLWYSMTSRGFCWIEDWIVSARKIEDKYLKDASLELNPVLNGNDQREKDKSWLKTPRASKILILMIAILYSIFLWYTLKENFSYNKTRPIQKKIIRLHHNFYDLKGRNRDFSN